MSQEIEIVVESLKARIDTLSGVLAQLASREIKKSQAESVAFALGSASNSFRFGDSHNLMATGENMDMNSCPICGTADLSGFCACLSVMAKSEDMIDLKNAADTEKRIKEVPGKHEGKLPSDAPIKEVDVGDGSGGKVKKSRIPGLNKADVVPLKKDFGLSGRAGVIADKTGTPGSPKPPMVGQQMANPMKPAGDMGQAKANWGAMSQDDKVARVKSVMNNPQMASLGGHSVAQQWLKRFAPQGGAAQATPGAAAAPAAGQMHAPNAAAAPRTIPGQKQVTLPGAGMNHAPKLKQAAGGDVVSPNPQKAAPGLGSMAKPAGGDNGIRGKLMRSEDQDQFEVFQKSESFDYGTCALCGQNEHIGNCK
jgi:hypothetical protein